MDDEFDALGPRPDRRRAFRGQLLSRESDPELDAIVQETARALSTPIAMVNLVLDHVQRFRAQLGLPEDLAVAGATDRRVSFCQFVVRDHQPFEVTDAERDSRVPQYLVQTYGIRAYLGMPLVVNDVVVGTLCVLCQEPRTFTDTDRRILRELSERANRRLTQLGAMSRTSRRALAEHAATPALAGLAEDLELIGRETSTALLALDGIHPLLNLVEQASAPEARLEPLLRALRTAREAVEDSENALCEVEAAHGDATERVKALQRLHGGAPSTELIEVTLAARELARTALLPIGGAYVPDVRTPVYVLTSQPLAVALVSAALRLLAEKVPPTSPAHDAAEGLTIDVMALGREGAVRVRGAGLTSAEFASVAGELDEHVAQEASVLVESQGADLWIRFAAADVPAQSHSV